jgi:hypothetical protein
VLSTIFFFLMYFVIFAILSRIWKPEFFKKHDGVDLSQWKIGIQFTALFHHFAIVAVAIYVIFIMPPQSPPLSLLISPTKANLDYYPITSIAGMFTIGYMIFDFFTLVVWLKDFSPLGKQHMGHHVLSIYIVVVGCIAGEHMPK